MPQWFGKESTPYTQTAWLEGLGNSSRNRSRKISNIALSSCDRYSCSGTRIWWDVILIIGASSSQFNVVSALNVLNVSCDWWSHVGRDATFSMSSVFLTLPTSAGLHQYVGYCRWILLRSNETTSVRAELSITSGRRNHPRPAT